MRRAVFPFLFLMLLATAVACRSSTPPSPSPLPSPTPSEGGEEAPEEADEPAGDSETTEEVSEEAPGEGTEGGDGPTADPGVSDEAPEESNEGNNIPLTAENWTVVYDGFGEVTFGDEVVLAPMAPSLPGETHSALVLAGTTETQPIDSFCLTIEATTEAQLRSTDPNPWEVFWIFFNYRPDGDFKETNYFILKTNGVELGRAFDDVGQAFLVTDPEPTLTLGTRNTFFLRKEPEHLTAWVDGVEVIDYANGPNPDFLYDHPGAIGLYTEDARVRIHSVSLDCPSNP